MLLFNIKTVWIITTIFVSIGFTGMFILYNIDKKKIITRWEKIYKKIPIANAIGILVPPVGIE